MSIIVLFSVGLITVSHRLILPFRKTGTISHQTAYDIFSIIMHATILLNLFFLFQWIGLLIAIALLFLGGFVSIPFEFLVLRTKLSPDELTSIFAILSWINIAVTITFLFVNIL